MDDEKAKEFVTDDNDFSSVGLRSLEDIQMQYIRLLVTLEAQAVDNQSWYKRWSK